MYPAQRSDSFIRDAYCQIGLVGLCYVQTNPMSHPWGVRSGVAGCSSRLVKFLVYRNDSGRLRVGV